MDTDLEIFVLPVKSVVKTNVFDDLGFRAEEAAILEMKTQLHLEIMRVIKTQKACVSNWNAHWPTNAL